MIRPLVGLRPTRTKSEPPDMHPTWFAVRQILANVWLSRSRTSAGRPFASAGLAPTNRKMSATSFRRLPARRVAS